MRAALLRAQLAWEDADVHPRHGYGSCEQCDTLWDTTFGPDAALSSPSTGLDEARKKLRQVEQWHRILQGSEED